MTSEQNEPKRDNTSVVLSRARPFRLTKLFSELCQVDAIRDAYLAVDTASSKFGSNCSRLAPDLIETVIHKLSSDLVSLTYVPAQLPWTASKAENASAANLRDRIVQVAIATSLSQFHDPSRSLNADNIGSWLRKNLRSNPGLCCVNAILPSVPNQWSDTLASLVRRRTMDNDFINLCGMVFTAYPSFLSSPEIRDTMQEFIFSGIDELTTQVELVFGPTSVSHATAKRFGNYVLLLAHDRPPHNWIVQAFDTRLRTAAADVNCSIDVATSQITHLSRSTWFRISSHEYKVTGLPNRLQIRLYKRESHIVPKRLSHRESRASISTCLAFTSWLGLRTRGPARLAVRQAALVRFLLTTPIHPRALLSRCTTSVRRNWRQALFKTMLLASIAVVAIEGQTYVPYEWSVDSRFSGFYAAQYWSFKAAKQIRYKFYVPQGDGKRPARHPLIVYLSPQTDYSRSIGVDDLSVAIRARLKHSKQFPFSALVLSEDAWGSGSSDTVMEIVTRFVGAHDVDPSRIFLIGCGRSTAKAWSLAEAHYDRWAALAQIDDRSTPSFKSPNKPPCWIIQGIPSGKVGIQSGKLSVGQPLASMQLLKPTEIMVQGHESTSMAILRRNELFEWFSRLSTSR